MLISNGYDIYPLIDPMYNVLENKAEKSNSMQAYYKSLRIMYT